MDNRKPTIIMKLKNIFPIAMAALVLTACEDYTEHNFGTPEELYQATQVNLYDTITLSDNDYAVIATNADNIALALAANDDSATYRELLQVAEKKCFLGNITPQEYLPAVLKNLVGTSQFYSMTAGSTIPIKFNQEVAGDPIDEDAYVPATGELTESEKFLLVPEGEAQVLAGSNNLSTGQTFDYGYIYLSGSTRYPDAVTLLSDNAIKMNEISAGYLYSIEKNGDTWLICNPDGRYLYMDASHNSFSYIDDLGDIEEEMYHEWNITCNDDGTYDIVNTGTQKVVLFGTAYSSAGAYADKKGTDGYQGIQLYRVGHISIETTEIEVQDITFSLDEEGWSAKGDYLNQELTGGNSLTDMDAVYAATGWSVEYIGSIGDLTYVWRYDSTYGLRGSAYKSSTYYPTDAWAISPKMNFKKAKNPVFTFEQAQKYAGTPVTDYLQVWISTDYSGRGGLEAATWTNITDKVEGTWPDGSDWTYYPMSIDLSEYAGSTSVNVAFRYISTDAVAATWEVKNVVCREAEETTGEE